MPNAHLKRERWLRTPDAVPVTGLSARTLKRYMDVNGGCLNHMQHYRRGPSKNSAILWEVNGVIEALEYRGMIARQGA